jgi:hypothetical protein
MDDGWPASRLRHSIPEASHLSAMTLRTVCATMGFSNRPGRRHARELVSLIVASTEVLPTTLVSRARQDRTGQVLLHTGQYYDQQHHTRTQILSGIEGRP